MTDTNIPAAPTPGSPPDQKEAELQARIKREAVRLVQMANAIGITKDAISLTSEAARELLDEDWYGLIGDDEKALVKKLYDKSYGWINNGDFVLIDGSDSEVRQRFAHKLLFRALLSDPLGEDPPRLVRAVDMLMRFQSFDRSTSRMALMQVMAECRCLYIAEFSYGIEPRVNDASLMIENLLAERRLHKRPTIISLAEPLENPQVVLYSWKSLSRTLEEDVLDARKYPKSKRSIHVRLKTVTE